MAVKLFQIQLLTTHFNTALVQSNPSPITPRAASKLSPALMRMGRILLTSLWIRAGFDFLFVIYAVVWATSYYVYYLLDAADTTGFLTYLIYKLVAVVDALFYPLQSISDVLYWVTVLFMLVWLYRLHINLKAIFGNYPISPWGAVARFIVPFYSLWGIWNMFTTLANHFTAQSKELAHQGISLRRSLLSFYGALIASNVLRQVYWFQVDHNASDSKISPWLYVLTNAAAFGLSVVWLRLVGVTTRAIAATVRTTAAKSSI